MSVESDTPWSVADVAFPTTGDVLPYGRGRSYGDCCLAADGVALATERLDRLLSFDRDGGVLRCESGISLADLLDIIVPAGWTLPVLPGTQFVSVGGAIANDVHGKNHERAGTFGRHVTSFELLRSDGSLRSCAPDRHADLYAATIGGLGLTGLITRATLRLARLPSTEVVAESLPFASVEAFVELSGQSQATHEFTVAWFDAYSWRQGRFKGVLQRANYASAGDDRQPAYSRSQHHWPMALAGRALMPWTIRRFNALYYRVQQRPGQQRADFRRYLFPLDAIAGWNRMYGTQGFYQLQCVFPAAASAGVDALLAMIAEAREGSFLAVLKHFGALASPGLMSFPMPGITLALDFRNRGESTRRLLANAAALVADYGGHIYPAKDATMSAAVFKSGFPAWTALESARDPRFQSRFWRRVTNEGDAMRVTQ
jgi:FAD/FMN-containing dehydrogenase